MIKTVSYQQGNILSYADYGDRKGFPVLVQHGMIASIKDSHLFARLIEGGARVICTARPGYGSSSPYQLRNVFDWGEIISVLVKELNLSQFDVLGISSGAPYSYAIGRKLPEQARNLYILSGTPALFDDEVRAHWPYPVILNANISEMQSLAYDLFFAHRPQRELDQDDMKDSLMHNCFGIALDLRIRCMDWGFRLSDVKTNVLMQHSNTDASVPFHTAELTANMLSNCQLAPRENDAHFSQEVLDGFLERILAEGGFAKGGEARASED